MVLEAPNVWAHRPTGWQVYLSGEAVALVVGVRRVGRQNAMNTVVWTEVVVLAAAAVVGALLGGWLVAPPWQAG